MGEAGKARASASQVFRGTLSAPAGEELRIALVLAWISLRAYR